jgi:hypothetical protein
MTDTATQTDIPSTVLERPALCNLITAMERLARAKRIEIARLGRRAKAAKIPKIRQLTRQAIAEAKRLATAQAA